MKPQESLLGMVFGRWTVIESSLPHTEPRGTQVLKDRCRCSCGNEALVYRKGLISGASTSCGCKKIERAAAARRAMRVDLLAYSSAHSRVRRDRGPAKNHTCPCGQPATDWAYDHRDPNELSDLVVRIKTERVRYYSADPMHYQALCRPCHRRHDLEDAQRRAEVSDAA